MGIRLINGGLLTTVQDEGRYGYQASGVQVSGVMDRTAALLANALVGNDELSEDAAEKVADAMNKMEDAATGGLAKYSRLADEAEAKI